MKRDITGLAAGIILLASTAVPWTVASVTNVERGGSYNFYVLDFLFMRYIIVPGFMSRWDAYEFAPKYSGIILVVIGGILAIAGGLKPKYERFRVWGGVLGVLAPILFIGSSAASITIDYPLTQSYIDLPVGALLPIPSLILTLISAGKTITILKPPTALFCAHCGGQVSLDFKLCPFCGAELVKPTCPKCGREISAEQIFCFYCGAKIR